jgi:hypothetical protein
VLQTALFREMIQSNTVWCSIHAGGGTHKRTLLQDSSLCYMGLCEPSLCFSPPCPDPAAVLPNSSSWGTQCNTEVVNGHICGAECSEGLVGSYIFICWYGIWSGPYGGCWQPESVEAGITSNHIVNSSNIPGMVASGQPPASSATIPATATTPAVCAGLPTSTPPAHSLGWPSNCKSTRDGDYCEVSCDDAAGYIDTVVSLCRSGKVRSYRFATSM